MKKNVVLLNASCEVINVIEWFKAVKLIMAGKAVKSYNCQHLYEIQTTSGIYHLPNSITLLNYVRIPFKKVSLTRKNIFFRENYTCQYCGERNIKKMTLDHVVPRSRNGGNTWENLVTCCRRCNVKKRDRTPEEARMNLLRKPERLKKDITFAEVERILQGETNENE
jgi:hypothetical protein